MDDAQIIALFWQRDEQAIAQTDKRYGKRLQHFAQQLLGSEADGKECVNDTYLKMWNSIPPAQPRSLSAYLYRILRSVGIDRLRAAQAEKRRASAYAASLEELRDCLPGGEEPECAVEISLLKEIIEDYLRGLPKEQRQIFLCRYYFMEPMRTIAGYFNCTEARIKSILHRVRSGLKERLKEEYYL